MNYSDLERGTPAIEKLYGKTTGGMKLKARRTLKPFQEELKAYREEVINLFKAEGAIAKEDGNLELEPPEEGDRAAIEKRNRFIKELSAMKEAQISIEVKDPFLLEDLVEVDISNPEIDQLILLGIAEE